MAEIPNPAPTESPEKNETQLRTELIQRARSLALKIETGKTALDVALQKAVSVPDDSTELLEELSLTIQSIQKSIHNWESDKNDFKFCHDLNNVIMAVQGLNDYLLDFGISVQSLMAIPREMEELRDAVTFNALNIDPEMVERFEFPEKFKTARILIIDDNHRIALVLEKILKEKGAAKVAHLTDLTGSEDLDFDIILLDDQLGNTRRGHELLPYLDKQRLIIAHTGNAKIHENPANAYAQAGLSVIHKCNLDELAAVLERN